MQTLEAKVCTDRPMNSYQSGLASAVWGTVQCVLCFVKQRGSVSLTLPEVVRRSKHSAV